MLELESQIMVTRVVVVEQAWQMEYVHSSNSWHSTIMCTDFNDCAMTPKFISSSKTAILHVLFMIFINHLR